MNMEMLLSYEWRLMTPEFIILGVAALVSLLDLFAGKTLNQKVIGYIGLAGVLVSILALISLLDMPASNILDNTFRLDAFSKLFKLILLIGTALVFLMSIQYKPSEGIGHKGEFYYLLLTALLGAMIMASSGDLITLFVGLELLSLSSYIMVGLRKKHTGSNEAAMKYIVSGGISTAVVLFGMSYIYGLTGSTNLLEIASLLGQITSEQSEFILSLASLLILVGLLFKVAVVPFHMWAPDVYEGAPTPVAAFLSVVSKTAGFIIIFRIFVTVFAAVPVQGGETSLLLSLQDYISILAALSMILGNVIALRQQNIKRLFAYSSIAHAGYIFVAFAALSPFILDAMWFYLIAYLFMTIGAFTIIQLVSIQLKTERLNAFTGLYQHSPLTAIIMGVFLLSLAGIPGTSGFIGKLNIFMGALVTEPAHYMLAGIMLAMTVVSYYYYFGLFVQMFFRSAEQDKGIKVPKSLMVILIICTIATVGLGIFPNVAYEFFFQNLGNFEDFFL